MISIAKLTDADVGHGVVYTPMSGPREDGVITSWNRSYVFVRYRGSGTSQATDPRFLDFLTFDLEES